MSEPTAEKTNAELSVEDQSLANMTLEQLLAKARAESHPWLPAIGIFEDDAVFEKWQQAIQDYRQPVDEDPKSLQA